MNKSSRFLVELHNNDLVAVFNTIFPRPIFFTKDYWLKIKSGEIKDRQVIDELRKRMVFVKDRDDEKLLSQRRKEAFASEGVSILYLILTNICNFSCKYCFEQERHGRVPDPLMTKNIAKNGLDLFVKNLRNLDYAVQIQLYGGEPLINWDVFVFSVNYIIELIESGRLPKLTKIIMLTNGSLLTDEMAAFIKAKGVEVGLSVDGPQKITDINRRFVTGEASFKSIMKALALIQKHKIPVMLSITVTPDNVACLPEMVSWTKKTGVKFIGFNPMGGESYSYVSEKMDKLNYDRLLSINLLKAFQKAAKNGIYEARIGRKVIEFVQKGFIFTDCGAVNSQLIIQPDGKIGYCHASRRYDVGSVFDPEFSIYNKGDIKVWRESLPINRSSCLMCPAISICGYGCFHHVLEDRGNVSFKDTQTCSYTRKLMQLLVWELYKKTKEKS